MLRGRGRELSGVLDVLRATAGSGQGQVVSVVGEPGIGKSALLHAVAEQARALGFAVGVGKAEEIDRVAAGAPLLVALRSGPGPLLDAASFTELGTLYGDRPIWLVDRIASMLEERALATPVLVAIDDVHWADELTRFALRLLPGRLSGSPVVWLTAGRPGQDDAGRGEPVGHRITLGPLRAEALEELATDRLGIAPTARTALLLRTVGGNPFWAVRLVDAVARDGDGELPVDLILGVRERLPDDPDLVELLRTCAVWGRPLPVADAAALLGLPVTRILAAAVQGTAEGLLQRDGSVVSFRHDLIREAVYADLGHDELVARHRVCGRYLLDAGTSALEAAPHFVVGADRDSVRVLRAAAAEAVETMPAAAVDLARRAFDLAGPGGPDRLEVGAECAALLVRVHRGQAAVEVVDRVLDERPGPDDRARLEVLASLALWGMDRLTDIAPRIEPVLAEPHLSPGARATLVAARTLSLIQTGSTADAAAAAGSALDVARAAGDPTAERLALLTLVATAKQDGRHDQAYRRTRELRELVGDDHLADEIRCLQLLDRYDDAAHLLAGAQDGAPADVDVRTPDLVHAQMWQEINLGRLDEGEVQARTLLRLADELGRHSGIVDAQSVLAFVALVRGEPDLARRSLAPRTPDEPHLHATARRLMSGWIALLTGDADAAAAVYAPLVAAARTSREYWPWFPLWARPLVQTGMVTGDRELVDGALHLARTGAERNPGVRSFAGLALQVSGIADDDVDALAESVTVLRGGPRPLLLASALADHGAALLAGGATAAALDRLGEAHRMYEDAGAALPAAALDRMLADAGIRPPVTARRGSRPTSGWASLTDTERRVADLIGAGHTNRAAATALGISPNTVSTHLRSVFAKLDVRSRVQLANLRNHLPERTP